MKCDLCENKAMYRFIDNSDWLVNNDPEEIVQWRVCFGHLEEMVNFYNKFEITYRIFYQA